MMLVGENRAWAALAAERCIMVAGTFREGAVSFFSPGRRGSVLLRRAGRGDGRDLGSAR